MSKIEGKEKEFRMYNQENIKCKNHTFKIIDSNL